MNKNSFGDLNDVDTDVQYVDEPIATSMAISTMLLRDLQANRRYPSLQPGGMSEIRESSEEDAPLPAVEEAAAAAISVAVKNMSSSNRYTGSSNR